MARITIVLNTAWNVWNFRLPLLQRLSDAGHEIVVLAPEDDYSARIPFPCYSIRIRSQSQNPVADGAAFLSIYRALKRIKPDILLLYTVKPNIYGNIAASLLGIKTISNIAGLGAVFTHHSLLTRLVRELYRHALKWPEKIFFQNQDDQAFFLRLGVVRAERLGIVPGSGVDLRRFRPAPQVPHAHFVFLLPARMLWDKGVREFAVAGARLLNEGFDVECRLLGFLDVENPEAVSRAEMDRLTERTGIVYRGVSDCIEEELVDADCVVLPSYREGTPRALLEAAAMAKPLITTDAVGCRNVVDDGINGFLCKPRDADDLYRKMKMMLKLGATERAAMGHQGRLKMEREYDEEIVISRYQQVIAQLTESAADA